jgi:acetylornithine deacetylase/succinyl-diaminopimelate desuccinylase-like protein
MANFASNSAFSRVTALASQRPVHAAFAWMHGNPKTIMDWQAELVGIPAPPFGEQARAEMLAALFAEAGLSRVETDAAGNVFGWLSAASLPPESTGPVVVLSAHLDTVFPAGTPLQPAIKGDRLEAPGACDNGAGLAGLLAIAHALIQSGVELPAPLVLLGNVGEEGEGDLRGVRCLYSQSALAGRIAAHIILEGAGSNSAVTQALGSRRFRVTVTGPGGHSFTDAGATPNPIAALALALAQVAETPLPLKPLELDLLEEAPRTTLNLGTIQGGTSVNSIPESAQATIDFRSTSADQLLRLEAALQRAVEEAVERTNTRAKSFAASGRAPGGDPDRGLLAFQIEKIGDRPAAELPADAPLLEALRAVDRHLGLHTDLRLGSTDANIPLSLGIPALSMGAGGEGGGAHTRAEWYSARNREAGLRRALLLTLAMLEWAAEQ